MSVVDVQLAPSRTTRPARASKKLEWGSPAVYFVALLLIAVMLAPVLYIILGGFGTNAQITSDPAGLPHPWNVGNYVDVLSSGVFWREVLNSTIAELATTVGVVALGLMVSYVLAKYSFRGRGLMYSCSPRA